MTDSSSPLATSRRSRILRMLADDGAVRNAHLADILDVSPVTLRRDLQQMEVEGLLVRVHGGAVPPPAGIPSAASLSHPHPGTRTIGVLVPSLDFYWPRVIRGMSREAESRGISLLVRGTSYGLQDERPVLERMRETEGVSGFVVAPNTDASHSADVISWLHGSGLPFVFAEREAVARETGAPVDSVVTDHALGAVLAVRHLASLGHRRLGLVLTHSSPTSRKIVAGWRAACTELELAQGDVIARMLPDRADSGFFAAVGNVIDTVLEAEATGLLVHSDREAMAIVDVANARGLSIPGDLSIVAYDDEVAEMFTPPLTAVAPPRAHLGRSALDLLVQRIAAPDRPSHQVTVAPALNVRSSTARQAG
ncbi:substrate-binding domain-containing protein [Microbacterium amylolyticum]|uniref:DNA-binding LacI/PurR family transcriptional regulator n=1 Tax=Microbacterium amylolyticum TaxID=936337 RepID=A0ABS4ZGG9_9MICO|nr:substrate-binding domain-containing protein [Microbacterium amylolyticum]MBP2436374.1 DNA-binding LacI/PurR family transcriptional regulator [Microbacterium amylolyticum]